MTIKQLGGVFGRNPTFNDVTIEGTLTFDGAIDITSDLTIEDNLYVLGSVGIGTTTPARLLELETTTANESYLRISGTSGNVADTNFAGIEFYNLDSSAAGPNVASFIEARAQTSTGAGGELVFATLPSTASEGDRAIERLRIDADGNVGIGESSPTFDVQIRRAAEVNLGLSYTGQTTSELAAEASAVTALKSSGNLRFVTNTSTEAMRIDNSGRVGISETNPSANLHISTNNTSTTNTATIRLEDTDTTTLGNQGIGRIEFYGNDSSGAGAGVKASIEAFGEDGSGRTTLKFSTANAVANDVGAMYINSSGQVGIGTVSPSAKLDTAYTDTATYSATSPSADLILSRKNTDNTANETVGIRFDVTGWSGSTTGGAAIEAIQTSNASTADLAFLTRDGGTWGERMRITSDGNLLVGKAASDVSVNGFEADNNGYTKITRTSGTANVNTVLQLNRLSTDGEILRLQKDGSKIGIIGVESNNNLIVEASTTDHAGLMLWSGASAGEGRITPRLNGANADATVDLGRSTNRFKDVYLSGGAYLGGTGAANLLDDYEEGTWTPAVNAGAISGTSITYSGTYTKIGRLVLVHFKASNTAGDIQVSSYVNFSGLPFTINQKCTSTVLTEDIDQFSRQGFASTSGILFALSACGSSTGTSSLTASIAAYV